MSRAFILSRKGDYWLAEKCRDRLNAQGWSAFIMIDPKEWDSAPEEALHASYSPGIKGMNGNKVALGILAGILAHSNHGDRVMKMDCDIWMSDEIAQWLAYGDAAKCFMLHRPGKRSLAWGGIWSANRDHVEQAIAFENEKCNCPESVLNVRALHKTRGILAHPSISITEWEIGMPRSGICTLPIVRTNPRVATGKALFEN